ncbi:MAG: hypothetical protein RBR71_13285 [Gudongella sp.]|jgi:hypothetical protein|nr:hypothetical protein [Gudongella sp.]
MTDLGVILRAIRDTPLTVEEMVAYTGYTETGIKAAIEYMVLRPDEYTLRLTVSKDGKTFAYQSFPLMGAV